MGDYHKKSYYGNRSQPNAAAFEEKQSKNPRDRNVRIDLGIKGGINSQKSIQEPFKNVSDVWPKFSKSSFEQTSTCQPHSQENDLNRRTSRTKFQHDSEQYCNIKSPYKKEVHLRTSETKSKGVCEINRCHKNLSIGQCFDHSSKSITSSDSENFRRPREKTSSSASDMYNNSDSSTCKKHQSSMKNFPSSGSDISSYSSGYKSHQSPKKNFPSSGNDISSYSSDYKNHQSPKKNFPSSGNDISCSSDYKNHQSPKKNFSSSTSDIRSCSRSSGYKNHPSTEQKFPSFADGTSGDHKRDSRDKFSRNLSSHQYYSHNSDFESASHNRQNSHDFISKPRKENRNKMTTFTRNSSFDNQESDSQFGSQTFHNQKKDCSSKAHSAINDNSFAPKVNRTIKEPLGQQRLNAVPDNCDKPKLDSHVEDLQSIASCSYTDNSTELSQSQLFHLEEKTSIDICTEIKRIIHSVLDPASRKIYLPKKQCGGVEWSKLLKMNNASDEVIRAVKNEEFHRYINQPAHKEGDGLYYSEFDDLPPRFKEKALQALLTSSGMDLKKVVKNAQSSTLNVTDVNCGIENQKAVAVNMVKVNDSSEMGNIDLRQRKLPNTEQSNKVTTGFLRSRNGKIGESYKQSKKCDKIFFHAPEVENMFQNAHSVIKRRENAYQKLTHLNMDNNYVTFLEVFVSNNAENIDYWNSYFYELCPFIKFVIENVHPTTQRFHLMFSDIAATKQMHTILRKHNRNRNMPYVVQVSQPKPYGMKKDSDKSNLEKCICDIFKMYDDYKNRHDQKIDCIYQELKKLRKNFDDASKNEREVVSAKLKMFKEMETVFKNCFQKIYDDLISESSIISKKHILDLKIRFQHECNNLAGCLPVYAKKDEIISLVSREQVSVLIADTGSGKSTQLVQYLLHENFTKNGWIVCTQPRKIAAVSICRYVSGLLGSQLGQIVGYDTGLTRKIFKSTRIVYMTDYTLLRKCVKNKKLEGISCIVLDEAHERSLYTDLLLGLIKRCLPLRKDLKVIITSATINPSIFLEYFNKCEDVLLKIPGRQYPVEIIWQNFDVFPGFNYLEASVKCAFDIHCQSGKGGILVFLTSPDETDEAMAFFCQLQRKNRNRMQPFQAKLMSLHGKLDTDEQLQIFNPIDEEKYRKVLFATNSAETSITVPGIRYVVDSGMIKERKYDADRKRGILAVGFVTQSSAEQRKGRAGRTQPGVCYRMYSKKNFEKDMAESPIPEILRVNLQQAVLEILHLGIQPETFNFISMPSKTSIEDALESLENLGAVKDKQMTELGEKIVKIPLEPQLSKLILCGEQEGVGYASVIVAAMVAVSRNIFLRPEDDQILADKIKLPFCCEEGDFHTLWWVFKQWERVPKDRKLNWCKNNFINSKAMRIGFQMVNELCLILSKELEISIHRTKYNGHDFDCKFQKVLFDSFSENLCVFSGQERSGYLSPFLEGSFFIHPSSSIRYLGVKMPKFVIFASILKTSRAFLHNVCPISEKTIIEAHQAGKFHLQIDLLKQLEVLPNVIQPVGESVLSRYILGKEGSKIREIEDTISALIMTRSSCLDVNVRKGEIVTYVEVQHQKSVNELLSKCIREAHVELGKEQMVCSVSEHLSLCVTAGGEIEDILLPGEFKELSIECKKPFFNVPKLRLELERFNLVSYYELQSSGKPKVQAVFPKVADAKRALKGLKANQEYIVTSKPFIPYVIDKPLSLYVIEIAWWRLPCKGTGWIDLESSFDCITASSELTRVPLSIKGNCINVEPARKNNKSLYMRNIPPAIEEEEILAVLKNRLQKSVKIKGVSLVRVEDSNALTDSDPNLVKKQLQRTFAPYTSLKDLTIDIKRPSRDDQKCYATLCFKNIEEGEKAMMQLEDNLKIGDKKAKLTSYLTSSIHLKTIVYDVLNREIEALKRNYKKQKTYVEFQLERKGNLFVCVNFRCANTESFVQIHKDLMDLVQGYHINCGEDKRLIALLSSSSLRSLNEIQSSYKTLVLTDSVRKIISIYGRKSSCMSTKSAIYSLAYDSEKVQRKKYNIRGENMPSGFLKTLYNRYGFNLLEFIKKFQLRYAYINLRRHQLILEGSVKRIEEAEAHLEEICAELEQNSINERQDRLNSGVQNETVYACPVCFDETLTDSIRLEHCGHAVCRPCLHIQVQSEVFPLTCIQAGCEKPFFVEDLRRIFAGEEDLQKQFCEAALKHFVNINSKTIQYCPSPNCSMVYRITTDGTEFSCPGCENDICTTCHTLYHHGMSCEMYQLSKVDSDHSVKVWLKEDIGNRKTCPECNSAIEKDGGCNHVTCLNCKSHMCWLCLRTFKTGTEVYDHMPFCEENS